MKSCAWVLEMQRRRSRMRRPEAAKSEASGLTRSQRGERPALIK